VLADSYPFLDVVWTMFVFFAWVMVVFLVITLMVDNFRRRDHSGWAKAGWTLVLILLPLLGSLIYMIARPQPTEDDLEAFGVPAGSLR
jgi:NADH:ubiquinone oxidoreductase subunit 6 (subunit J)